MKGYYFIDMTLTLIFQNNKKVHVSADAEIEQTAVKVKHTPFVVRFNESGGLLDKEKVSVIFLTPLLVRTVIFLGGTRFDQKDSCRF